MPQLVGINTIGSCNNKGGLVKSFGTLLSNITAVTLTSGVISNFTMGTSGTWKLFQYDNDNTANYAETGALNSDVFSNEQAAFLKFKGGGATNRNAANIAAAECDVVFIHVFANGDRVVQGIELDATAVGGFIRTQGRNTRIVPTITSGTGNTDPSRIEFNVGGNANTFSPTTSLTDAAILAL